MKKKGDGTLSLTLNPALPGSYQGKINILLFLLYGFSFGTSLVIDSANVCVSETAFR
jgi:hypothetical protein